MSRISYSARVTALAQAAADAPAVVHEDRVLRCGELERRARRLARAFGARGVAPGDRVVVALPNGLEWFWVCLAAWKLGAVPTPISAGLPAPERDALVHAAQPALVYGGSETEAGGLPHLPPGYEPEAGVSDAPLPDRVPPHERALASGGSAGRPKLIVAAAPGSYDPDAPSPLFCARRASVVPGPLRHAVPMSAAWQAILGGATAVVMTRFEASDCLALVEAHRADRLYLVPTMMLRIWRLPEAERLGRNLSSLEFVLSGGAPLAPWLMRAWIDWLVPTSCGRLSVPASGSAGR